MVVQLDDPSSPNEFGSTMVIMPNVVADNAIFHTDDNRFVSPFPIIVEPTLPQMQFIHQQLTNGLGYITVSGHGFIPLTQDILTGALRDGVVSFTPTGRFTASGDPAMIIRITDYTTADGIRIQNGLVSFSTAGYTALSDATSAFFTIPTETGIELVTEAEIIARLQCRHAGLARTGTAFLPRHGGLRTRRTVSSERTLGHRQ